MIARSIFLHLGSAALMLGPVACGGGGGSTASAPASTPSPMPVAPSAPASVNINRALVVGNISPAFVGLSYEKLQMWSLLFSPSNSSLIGCFKRLGASVLRIGGNSLEQTTWNPTGARGQRGFVAPPDVDDLTAFLRTCNWKVIYGIGLARNTPAVAAAEASYAAQSLGDRLIGIEIGNEPDLYATNGLRAPTYSYADFRQEWEASAAAVRAAARSAPLIGPASAYNTDAFGVPFARDEAASVSLLTQHYYRGSSFDPNASIGTLLQPDPRLAQSVAALTAAASAYGIAGGFRLAECNSFYDGDAPNVSSSYGSALWAIDFLFTVAMNGATGVNFHSGGGTIGYTPLADAGGVVVGVRPEYYGALLVALAGSGALLATTLATSLALSAYAVATGPTSLAVVLVNQDQSTAAHTTIALGATAASASPLVLSGPSLSAQSGVTLGGAAIAVDGSWAGAPQAPISIGGSSLSVVVPPASALLLTIK